MIAASEIAWLIPVLPLIGAVLTGLGLISFNQTINRLVKKGFIPKTEEDMLFISPPINNIDSQFSKGDDLDDIVIGIRVDENENCIEQQR